MESRELSRVEELDLERRKADAIFEWAQKAKKADDELLPYARARLDAWREWGIALREAEIGRPKGNVTDGNVLNGSDRVDRNRARKVAKVPEEKFLSYREAENPDDLTLAGLYRIVRKKELDKTRRDLRRTPDEPQLIEGDFTDPEVNGQIADGSVGMIFTDPPYAREHEWLYGELGSLGARVLRDGGSLVCYVGHHSVAEVVPMMREQGMRLFWMCAVIHEGGGDTLPAGDLRIKWKPLLWFVKGKPIFSGPVQDAIQSERPKKDNHGWEQSPVEALYYIERLAESGETVLDPMCGSGTTLVAARQAGRSPLGIEKDPKAIEIAKARLRDGD